MPKPPVRLPGKHGHRVVATVGDSNVTKPVGAEVADAHGHRLMADADGPADGEAVTGVAAHDEQPIAGAVGHEQTDSVVRGPFGYRTRLHPVAERDRHRRSAETGPPTSTRAGGAASGTAPHAAPRHHRGGAGERYSEGGSKQRGASLSPNEGR